MYKKTLEQCKDLQFIDFYNDGEKMLFTAWNINGFFSYDEKNACLELISMLPGKVLSNAQFIKYLKCGNELIWIPYHSSQFFFYNLETNKIKTISVDDNKCMTEVSRFCDAYYVDGKIYCCPGKSHSFVEYEMKKNKFSYYSIDEEMTSELYREGKGIINFTNCVLIKNKIYALANNANKMISFDITTKEIDVIYIKTVSEVVKLLSVNGILCLVLKNGNIYNYCENGDAISKIYDLQCQVEIDDCICTSNGQIFFHKNKKNQLVQVTQNGFKHSISYENVLLEGDYLSKAKLKVNGNTIYILPNRGNIYIKMDMNTRNLERHKIIATNAIIDKYLFELWGVTEGKKKIYESSEINAGFYMEMIKRKLL